jgi:hypothetical protein
MTDPRIPNRRTTARKALRCAVRVELASGASRNATMWDVGIEGMSLVTTNPISPGTRCHAAFELPLAGGPLRLDLAAKAVYCSYTGPAAFKVGLVFSPLDAASERAIDEFVQA